MAPARRPGAGGDGDDQADDDGDEGSCPASQLAPDLARRPI
jgi:hypothetical protein